jgi:hypothetical protein
MHAYIHTHTHTYLATYISTRTRIGYIFMHAYIHKCSHINKHTRTYTHACMHACAHKHTNIHNTNKHKRTHTHTHTLVYIHYISQDVAVRTWNLKARHFGRDKCALSENADNHLYFPFCPPSSLTSRVAPWLRGCASCLMTRFLFQFHPVKAPDRLMKLIQC